MNKNSFSWFQVFAYLALLLLSNPLVAYRIAAELDLIPSITEDVVRWEVRGTNSDGSLLVGNLQSEDLLQGFGTSLPVYWVKTHNGWDLRKIPGASEFTGGFSTIMDVAPGGIGAVLVGRANRGEFIEGFAHNYVSGETYWAGGLEGVEVYNRSRFTGSNAAGTLLAGSATTTDEWWVPVIAKWGGPLVEIGLPEGALGGWLYRLNGAGTEGSGYVEYFDEENSRVYSRPARWNDEGEGMVLLPEEFEGGGGNALSISLDGRFLMGRSRGESGTMVPTYWDRDAEYAQSFPQLPDANVLAGDVTSTFNNGELFFGTVLIEDEFEVRLWTAVVWDSEGRVEYFSDFVRRNYGLELADGFFRSASQHPQSRNIFGSIQYDNGFIAPFVIRLQSRADGFQLIDYPFGGLPRAEIRDLSNEGAVIVGNGSGMSGEVPAYWTAATGWQFYPFLPDSIFTPFYLNANAVTPDGSVSVGRTPSARGTPVAFIYNQGSFSSLGFASESADARSLATGVSDDGQIVVGQATFDQGGEGEPAGLHAMIWEDATGIQRLPVADTSISSWAYGVSGDGTLAVGWMVEDGIARPTKWSNGVGGFTRLGVPSGFVGGQALAVSEDGSVIVGSVFAAGTLFETACYWTSDGEPTLIPPATDLERTQAWKVSAYGSWISGQEVNPGGTLAEGFIFHSDLGSHTLQRFMLKQHGRVVESEFRARIIHISPDGKWLVGDVADPLILNSRVPFRLKIPERSVRDYFDDVVEIPNTSYRRTWFGTLEETDFPLVYHERHGWLLLKAWGESGGYAYDPRIGWMHIDRDRYPYLRIYDSEGIPRWYYFESGTKDQRVFFDLEMQVSKTVAELGG